MPKTRLISPGSIPNHKLLKNLQLQDNYISNDGDDEGIRIANSGNVGIGNSVPGSPLEVSVRASSSEATRPCIEISSFSDANDVETSAGVLKFHKSANDVLNAYGSGSHTVAGEVIGRIEAWGVTKYIGSQAPILSSYIEFAGDAQADPSDAPGKIVFATADADDDGDPTVRMTIDDDGRVGIGVTDPDSLLEIFGESAQLKLSWDASNYAAITVADDGEIEIATTGTDAAIRLDAAGAVIIESGSTVTVNNDMSLSSGKVIYFDSADTKIGSNADDPEDMIIEADQDILMSPDNHLVIAAGGHVEFDGCGVGFDKIAATFGASAVIGDPNDSTDIDFRLGNKYELELTDNLGGAEKLNFIFPATSGNFLIVLIQDGSGSRTIHADSWTAYQSDGSTEATNVAGADGTDGDLRWAGGSAPTLTTTADKSDIVSIYWDADNQTAFAVISQNF